jgi:outer membrane protein OmpA-like peptidoglycan-associated protein
MDYRGGIVIGATPLSQIQVCKKGSLMRASLTLIVTVAVCVAAMPLAFITSARAGPAYSSEQVMQVLLKDKAAVDAYKSAVSGKSGPPRKICVGTAEECPAPSPPTVAHFDLLVNFEFNSEKLTQAAKENLDQFAKTLLDPRLSGEKFGIDGHTDAVGAEQYNQGLSERRANAVVSYLASQGVDASTLIAKGFGKTKPRVANPYSAENRRVETHLVVGLSGS